MKLVKIGGVWLNPTKVIRVEGFNNITLITHEEHKTLFGPPVNLIQVDLPLEEVAAIINGGLV